AQVARRVAPTWVASGAGSTDFGSLNILSTAGHGSSFSPKLVSTSLATKVPSCTPNATSAEPRPGHGPRILQSSESRSSIHFRQGSHGPSKRALALLRDAAHAINAAIAPS